MKRNQSSSTDAGQPSPPAAIPATPPEPGAREPLEAGRPGYDTIAQIETLMQRLKSEREELVARLEKVDQLLGLTKPPPPMERPKNEMTLKEAVIEILKRKPATKPEILDQVKKMGYEFSGKDPRSSINVVLYTRKNGFRKMEGGRFLAPED